MEDFPLSIYFFSLNAVSLLWHPLSALLRWMWKQVNRLIPTRTENFFKNSNELDYERKISHNYFSKPESMTDLTVIKTVKPCLNCALVCGHSVLW